MTDIETIKIAIEDNINTTLTVYKNNNSNIVVVFLTALGVGSRYYKNFLNGLANKGINIVAVDIRGVGSSTVKASKHVNFGYKDILDIDLPRISSEINKIFPKAKRYWAGHSIGAQFCLLYASKNNDIDGVISIAGGSNYWQTMPSYKRIQRIFNIYLVQIITKVMGYFPGNILKFGGLQGKNLMLDWCFEGINGFYRIVGCDFDYKKSLEMMQIPTLFVSLDGDTYVPIASSMHMVDKLTNSNKEIVLLNAGDCDVKKVDHFKWARSGDCIADVVNKWIIAASC